MTRWAPRQAPASALTPATDDEIASRVPPGFATTADAAQRSPGRALLRLIDAATPAAGNTIVELAPLDQSGWTQLLAVVERNTGAGGLELSLMQATDPTFADRVRVWDWFIPDVSTAPRWSATGDRLWLPDGFRYRFQARSIPNPGYTAGATVSIYAASLPDAIS